MLPPMHLMREITSTLSSRDTALYYLALKVAEESNCSDKHGTVIMRAGVILAVAANRFIGNPMSTRFLKKTIHSEQRALLRLGPAAHQATLYTARLHHNKQSKPCVMCQYLIEEAGITTVVFHDGKTLIKEKVGSHRKRFAHEAIL